MSFESAKRITPESFNQEFQFTRRPSVRYPAKNETKQSVNISHETISRSARRRTLSPYAGKLSYGKNGMINHAALVGQRLNALV